MRAYIAGPMSGLPNDNHPAFNNAAKELRLIGYKVENPAENPVPPCGGTWVGWMKLALAQLLTVDVVFFLPGWEKSKGARMEFVVASGLELEIRFL